MKIVCMMRIKNEARWLREVLLSIQPLTTDIVIFDDHSTDTSRRIAVELNCAVLRSPFPEGDTDEVRDKNMLLSAVRIGDPDYVLAIDGDEILEDGAAPKILSRLRSDLSVYSFPIRYLWNDRQHYRADGVYGRFQRASMFSLAGQPATVAYHSTPYGANFHCGNVPRGLVGSGCMVPANLLHLGYLYAADRIRKYKWYNRIDPNNGYEDRYRHMVIGDVFPADSKFLHGGPLKLFSLPRQRSVRIPTE